MQTVHDRFGITLSSDARQYCCHIWENDTILKCWMTKSMVFENSIKGISSSRKMHLHYLLSNKSYGYIKTNIGSLKEQKNLKTLASAYFLG